MKFDTFEVCLAVRSMRDTPHERVKEGDIVYVRRPGLGLSPLMTRMNLWLRIDGLDNYAMFALGASIRTADDNRYDKRRYCIPLARLPGSPDLSRIRDITDAYQPFMPIDEDNLSGGNVAFLRIYHAPYDVHGLVYDKQTTRFL